MKVYFITGMAADKNVFKYIQLPENCEAVYLDWIAPMRNDSLTSYASRLADKIDHTVPFGLIGLSMGGMIAAEIKRLYDNATLVLISSIPSSNHLPGYFTFVSKFRLHKIVPISLLKSASIIKRAFTTESAEDKIYLKETIRQSDPVFIRWAIDAV